MPNGQPEQRETIETPDGALCQIWGRNSLDHHEVSVECVDGDDVVITEPTEIQQKYHGYLVHCDPDCPYEAGGPDCNYNKVKAKLIAGERLNPEE